MASVNEVPSLITEPVVELIMRAKAKMPVGWKIQTYEEDYWIVLHIPDKEFWKFSIHDRIRIAEATNQLCENIKATGIQCYVERI